MILTIRDDQPHSQKPELVLHIGQSKTGTTSIQRVLGERRDDLLRLGVCYPVSPGRANHGLLPASLIPPSMLGVYHPDVWEGMEPQARLTRFRREFAEEMEGLGPDIRLVVLSAEQCSGLLMTREAITDLKDLLSPFASRIRVVVYLRRQDAHFASGYTQMLRDAKIRPPTMPNVGAEELPHYDYARLLDDWAAVFGEDAIEPHVFERGTLVNDDAVDDFLASVGIPLTVPSDDPNRKANLSLSPSAIHLVRSMGTMLQESPEGLSATSPLWRRFVRLASDVLPGRGWRPDADEAATFLARFDEVNEAVRRRWFPDRPRLFSDAPQADEGSGTSSPSLDTAAALEAALAVLASELTTSTHHEAQLHAAKGTLHLRLGEVDAARTAFRAAVRVVPDHPLALRHLAEMALADGDREAAEAHCTVLRANHPEHKYTSRVERLLRKTEA